jgi:hypothetical protein
LTPELEIVKSAFPSVQIVNAAPELYSFACRWYASPSSCVTWSLAPPFWLLVQSLPVGAGEDVVGVGVGVGVGDVLGDVLGDGVDGDVDGRGSGLADEGEEVADGVELAPGRRLGRALRDGLADGDDEDGTGSGPGDDDAGPDGATQSSRTELDGHLGTRTDTPVSFPDDRQA